MIPIPLQEEISRQGLEALVTNKVSESRTLDYKQEIKLSSDEDKRELARDVSSFANAAGGDLIFGAVEARDAEGKKLGYPEMIVGVSVNFDDAKLKLENIIRDTIDPRVQGIVIRKVDGFDKGSAIIVRIPKSWTAPHMVRFSNQTHFYSRNNSGKQPLDVREIRAGFLAGTEMSARVRQFRDARVGSIISGETPVRLSPGPKLILHAIPLLKRDEDVFDLKQLADGPERLAALGCSRSYATWRFNLDGLVAFFGFAKDGPKEAYTQAFRDGALEGVGRVHVTDSQSGTRSLYPLAIEKDIKIALSEYSKQQRRANVNFPVSVHVTVIGVKGMLVHRERMEWMSQWEEDYKIDREVLLLPNVLLETDDADYPTLLRPIFDALWQAGGHERSFGYDQAGNWDEGAHPEY